MRVRPELARRLGCCDAPLVLAVLLVALAVSPAFVDRYTSIKWYALEAVAAAWLLAERLLCGGRGCPSFVRRTWIGWVALVGWVVLGSLRQGPAWAVAPLVARGSFAAITFASYWCFRRTGPRLGALRGSVAVAAAVVAGIGLAQLAGARALPGLQAGDGLSATFGNVNMAAQFLGLALVVVLSGPAPQAETRRRARLTELLGACVLAYVVLVAARSVALSLVAALAVLALARRLQAARLARMVAVAAPLVIVLLLQGPPAGLGLLHPGVEAFKAESARWRLAVWSDTLALVRDHPLGVGAGNFEHAFAPYALAGRSRPGELLVFRSPHNDYLRLLAEEGIPGATVLLALVLALARELSRSPGWWRSDAGALVASGGAFLAVEALFQFPFELPFPALLAAVLLGLALAALEVPGDGAGQVAAVTPIGRWRTLAVVVAVAAIVAGCLRSATAEVLFTMRGDHLSALERACALDPRRLEACVQAAWLHSRTGRHAAARRLLADVLERSPRYLPAMKLLAEDRLAAGDREAGCRDARAYDALLGGTSSLRTLVARECRKPPP